MDSRAASRSGPKHRHLGLPAAAWLVPTVVAALSLVVAPSRLARAAGETFSDPFAYCKAVGTVDTPDARYDGPKMPEPIARALEEKFGARRQAMPEIFVDQSFWRCMDGKVYACMVGANIPCQEKADTSRTPSAEIVDYCKTNPVMDYVPAFVTGRATIYLWSCTDGKPVIVRELTKPDAAGFLANAWHEIAAP